MYLLDELIDFKTVFLIRNYIMHSKYILIFVNIFSKLPLYINFLIPKCNIFKLNIIQSVMAASF